MTPKAFAPQADRTPFHPCPAILIQKRDVPNEARFVLNPKIDAYIISWRKQHGRAVAIASQLVGLVDRLTIIHSDDEPFEQTSACNYIVVANDWFYGRKFATTASDFVGDVMLHITADVLCDDWVNLIDRCRRAFALLPQLGVWAPDIDYCYWNLRRTAVSGMKLFSNDSEIMTDLSCVTIIDSIVWAMKRDVVDRLVRLNCEQNNIGWGIDQAASAYCHANNKIVMVDSSVKVLHPKESGYDHTDAHAQCQAFLDQLTLQEKMQLVVMKRYGQAMVGEQPARTP